MLARGPAGHGRLAPFGSLWAGGWEPTLALASVGGWAGRGTDETNSAKVFGLAPCDDDAKPLALTGPCAYAIVLPDISFAAEASIPKEFRINEQIRAREVRIIGENGEQLGIMTVGEAIRLGREQNLDLVEVAPTAAPPVCRLLDYGRFRYDQAKKERESRKNQHTIEIREVRFRPKIDSHDLTMKVKQAGRLLQEGDKVKVSVMFRGREMTHPELGRALLERVSSELTAVANVEKPIEMEGRNMSVIFVPQAPKEPKPVKPEAEEKQES